MVLTQGFVESSLGVAPEARKRVAGGKRQARSRRSRVVASPPRQGRQRAMSESAAPAGAGFAVDASGGCARSSLATGYLLAAPPGQNYASVKTIGWCRGRGH